MGSWDSPSPTDWGGSQPSGTSKESITPAKHQSNASAVASLSVDDSTAVYDSTKRVNQQQVIPAAVKGRNMLPVQDDGGVILTVGAFVPDGRSTIANLTTTSTNGGMLISEVYWQIYVDNKIPSQRIPQNISSALYPFYIWNNLYDNVGSSINNQPGKTIASIQVRNAVGDGSTHLIIIEAYPRMVINGSTKSSS